MDNNGSVYQQVGNCQKNKIRTNIFLTPELKEYVQKMSDEMGMSNSAFMVMCISYYKQSQEIPKYMTELKEILSKYENNVK